jgi:hypothetical protein
MLRSPALRSNQTTGSGSVGVRLVPERSAEHAGMGSTVTIALADGRRFEGHAENGMLEQGELADKFSRLTRAAVGDRAPALYERLQFLEGEKDLTWL